MDTLRPPKRRWRMFCPALLLAWTVLAGLEIVAGDMEGTSRDMPGPVVIALLAWHSRWVGVHLPAAYKVGLEARV